MGDTGDWAKLVFFIVVIVVLEKIYEYMLIPALIQVSPPFGFLLVVFAIVFGIIGMFKLFESLFER